MTASDIVLDPILPVPMIGLLALIVGLITVRVYLRVGAAVAGWQNGLLLGCRLLGLGLLLALLLQPSRVDKIPPPARDRVTLIGLDSSRSMEQRDVNGATRLDAARNLLVATDALSTSGLPEDPRLRFFEFNDDARPIHGSAFDLSTQGRSTRFHRSILTAFAGLERGEAANALVLLTDGHDFELVNPAQTGAAARSRQTPIYAIALGRHGKVRDVSTRVTSFQPYCYVKQTARITAAVRLIGCEFEDLNIRLFRQGEPVQAKRLNADEFQELTVTFDVVEPETGQYEYEIRVQPLPEEVDEENNSAITYLNVIDQQVRVLLLEGEPYWDTTFLQRSLMRNDKFDVDSLVRYGPDRTRAIRKTEGTGDLDLPRTAEEFSQYDVVILGRGLESLLAPEQVTALTEYVKGGNGTVVFARGPAFAGANVANDLEPVIWGEGTLREVRLQPTAEGQGLSAFQGLNPAGGGVAGLPELIGGQEVQETRPLASTLALGIERGGSESAPALVHRRFGRGQVVSVGVAGLWRWGLNMKVEGANSPFDRFWDQALLWLLAGRDFIPTSQFSFRTSAANILLGEKIHFRLVMRHTDPNVRSVPLNISFRDRVIGRVNLTAGPDDPTRLTAEFLPEQLGRYSVEAQFPDGTRQESRFIVFTENFEETEVATDLAYLRRLCEASGGRLLDTQELHRLLGELGAEQTEATPKTRICPIWNDSGLFYLLGTLFGLDWLLRRRWGLS